MKCSYAVKGLRTFVDTNNQTPYINNTRAMAYYLTTEMLLKQYVEWCCPQCMQRASTLRLHKIIDVMEAISGYVSIPDKLWELRHVLRDVCNINIVQSQYRPVSDDEYAAMRAACDCAMDFFFNNLNITEKKSLCATIKVKCESSVLIDKPEVFREYYMKCLEKWNYKKYIGKGESQDE